MNNSLIINQCRICYDDIDESELFSPCRCNGTSKYVHRECLYEWINKCENVEAKSKCMECNFTYKNVKKNNSKCYSIADFITKIFSAMYIVILLYNSLFGYMLYQIDDSMTIFSDSKNITIENNSLNLPIKNSINCTIYLYWGCLSNLFIFGTFVIINICYYYIKYKNILYIEYQYKNVLNLLSAIIIFIFSYLLISPIFCIIMLIIMIHYHIMNYCDYIKFLYYDNNNNILDYNQEYDNYVNNNILHQIIQTNNDM